ncbi:activator of 90 kDa heat shock ATPase homolog 1 [Pelobates cultripes]|uniref:Activator of 90 kDa heat shock protein ATPase homolog 1 n=1 Tax=Pelobates cultripes TaxID=61616 RepID=A0AAD1TN46_PELCU|nr:activator of 90 kDa heat shock ATPase homolog 1 [Pelobates cultripes]CAH2328462.1 activator of 90 kDa heat shock ATPase homolog 1 [Pelobates cultripes]
MAKWGQGDPRWIVELRSDGTNVNNWHWTERDATAWSTDKLKDLFMGVRVEGEEGTCEVTEVSKLEGEASINNRKGKLIFFYEWDIKLNWTGISQTGVKYKGYVEIPNLSDENNASEVEIRVSMAKDEPDTNLIGLMRKQGAQCIRDAVAQYISTLKTEFTQGMILPTANGISDSGEQEIVQKAEPQTAQTNKSSTCPSTGVKIPTCKFTLKETFLTSPEELYRVLTQEELVQGFTHAPASLTADKGGKFQLLGGNVSGEFVELEPEKKIVMSWRFKSWPSGHHATVTLTFKDKGGETELGMDARGVPKNEEDRTKEGWKRYYFDGIKQTFGFGALLL